MKKIGVDLGGHTISAAAVDFSGQLPRVVSNAEAQTPESRSLADVSALIADMVATLASGDASVSVGIGVPGFVELGGRRIARLTNFHALEDVEFALVVESAAARKGLDARVVLGNDANCAALGEGLCGAAVGCRDYVVLTLGTGIGSGIVVNGGLVLGAHGMGGEAGHISISENGLQCGCGGVGHLEPAVSADWVEKRAAELGLPEDFKTLWENRRDAKIAALLETSLDALARGIASLVSVLDPEIVVLSGGMSRAVGIADELKTRAAKYLPVPFRRCLKIEISKLGSSAATIGAASLCGENFK